MKVIVKLEYQDDDLTVWFEDSDQPFAVTEFEIGSETRLVLELLDSRVRWALVAANHLSKGERPTRV